MRNFLLILSTMFITLLLGSCSIAQPAVETEIIPFTQTTIPSWTATSISNLTTLPQVNPTSTFVPQRFEVIEIVPSHRCEVIVDKNVFTVAWKNDNEFIFAYYPLVQSSGNETPSVPELQWVSHNIETGAEILTTPFINFDSTFWEKNHIESNALKPELAGYFSPSGKYVIYSVFLGKSFEPNAKNEIWVAETNSQRKWRIFESSGNAISISRAAWLENETKVIFNMAYEGPTEFYISDFKEHETVKLAEVSQFSGITEETWRLSPDGKTLAVVDFNRQLILVSLDTGQTQIVDHYGGSFPQWSIDGSLLYYWWRADQDNWWGNIDELRVFEISSQKISTMLDQADLVAGFSNYEGDGNCMPRDYYLAGLHYAVSPNQESILLWDNWLYVLLRK